MVVEAELVAALLDAGVQGAVVAPERHREDELVLRRVSQEEAALGLVLQQRLRLVPERK